MPVVSRPLLAIPGSLRARSINKSILLALQQLAAARVQIAISTAPGELPHFNPDLDVDPLPAPVTAWRDAVQDAAALVICSPEYAHGVPGTLKNALDWLVSDPRFPGKPVALISARHGTTYALDSLRETLTVMSAIVVDAACVTLPLTSNQLDSAALLARPDIHAALNACLEAILHTPRAANGGAAKS